MRNLKRALSLALASVMLVGMMVVGTSAASYPDVDSNDNVEAIAVLQAVEVMQGDADTGNFRPDDKVSRNEMAVIMARLMLGPDAEDYVGTHPFTDVPAWADKYVAACYNEGIIMGMDETTYGGTSTITAEQAAAMMMRALGYEKLEGTGADWAKPVVAKANSISLFKGLGGNVKAELTRNQIAQLGLNTLKATCVDSDVEQDIVVEGIVTIPGKVTYKDRTTEEFDYKGGTPSAPETLQLCEKLYGNKLVLHETGVEDDLGRPATNWTYDGGDPVGEVAKDADYTVVVNEKKTTMSLNEWAKEANKKLTIKSSGGGATITANNCTVASAAADALKIGDVVEFYDVTSNEAATVIVTRYSVGKIDKVEDCNPNVKKDKDAMEDDGASVKVTLKTGATFGSSAKFYDTDITGYGSDFAEGAYIAYVPKRMDGVDKIIASYVADTTDGKITAVNSKDSAVKVDGETYTIEAGVTANLGSEYTLVLDKNGLIIGSEEIAAADVDLSEVLFVVKAYSTTENKYGADTFTRWVQTVSMDGVIKDYALYTYTGAVGTLPTDDNAPKKDGKFADISDGDFIVVEENDDTKDLWDASKAYVGADDPANKISKDYKISTIISNGANEQMEVDDTKLAGKATRVNDSTKYIIAEKDSASLKVYQATGGIEHKLVSGNKVYAITESVKGTDVALYVVVTTQSYGGETSSKDVVYVDAGADFEQIEVKGGSGSFYQFDIYDPNGEAMTVVAKQNPTSVGAGFKTYSIKETGDDKVEVYTFKNDAPLDADLTPSGSNYDNDKETGIKSDKFESYYGTELDLNAGAFKGIETKDAAFVDLHDEDVYGGSILSLEDMYNAADDGYTVNLAVYLNKGAKLIVVTGVVAPHVHAGLVWTPTVLKTANCHETGNPAYWTAGSCTGTGVCPLDGKHYDANGTATGSNGHEIADADLTTQIDSSNHDAWGSWGACSDATHDGHNASGCWVRTCTGCSEKEYTTTDPT